MASASADMRYNEDTSTSQLPLEAPPATPYLNLIPPPQPPIAAYSDHGGPYYNSPTSLAFPGLDARPRLGTFHSPSPGMAHGPRLNSLPLPLSSTRDVYMPSTPNVYRRGYSTHNHRSAPYSTAGRGSISLGYPHPHPHPHPLPLPLDKMGSAAYGARPGPGLPPFDPVVACGTLSYGDSPNNKIAIEIFGSVDKGFFLSDLEWTCYRRNYFSCTCSYNLSPFFPNQAIHFSPAGGQSSYIVNDFAMSISAIVSDSEENRIELVQHTPKRDKGPTSAPDKVPMMPKTNPPSHHAMSAYGAVDRLEGYGSHSHPTQPTEHTFERVQFKQATANNGKRRAAQQYYHLVVELFADVGTSAQADGTFVRVAYRKSAKMIVRGRSPGHYHSDRRGSASSHPGSGGGDSVAGGNFDAAGYASGAGAGAGAGSSSRAKSSAYPYERPGGYGSSRAHGHDVTLEPTVSQDDMNEDKTYNYYTGTLYERYESDEQDGREYHHHAQQYEGEAPDARQHHHHAQQYEGNEQDARQHHHAQQYENHDQDAREHHHHAQAYENHDQDVRQHHHHAQQQQHQQHHHQSPASPQQTHPHPHQHQPAVDLFTQHVPRHDHDLAVRPQLSDNKMRPSMVEAGLPPLHYSGLYGPGCARFDSKPVSTAFYPVTATMMQ